MTGTSKADHLAKLALLFFLSLSIACSDPLAEFTESSEVNIPPPTFNGKTEATVTIASPFIEIPVSGECDVRSKALSTQIDGIQSQWTTIESVSAGEPTINCKEQVFSFKLPSLKTYNKFDLTKTVTLKLHVKALTVAGYSEASTLTVIYDPSAKGGNPPGFVTGPSGDASGSTHFKLKARLSYTGETELSGSHFKLQGGFRSTTE